MSKFVFYMLYVCDLPHVHAITESLTMQFWLNNLKDKHVLIFFKTKKLLSLWFGSLQSQLNSDESSDCKNACSVENLDSKDISMVVLLKMSYFFLFILKFFATLYLNHYDIHEGSFKKKKIYMKAKRLYRL